VAPQDHSRLPSYSGQKAFQAQIERGGSTSEFKNPSLEIKAGMPCSSCNGGWMSALENQVKPFSFRLNCSEATLSGTASACQWIGGARRPVAEQRGRSLVL
jgi:hypothetical protein